ncbi:ComF family protein [Tepidamorphus sp. 3E244]|uniref:ComF family protein n=1 Tax=Tepidamorphus sp. 3E244 TaxID=3385498 RepID=UPI0038FD2A5B
MSEQVSAIGRLRQWGAVWSTKALDMVLPPLCMGCGDLVTTHGGVCAACWRGLTFIEPPVCPVMGTPLEPGVPAGTLSAAAIAAPPPFARLRGACDYDATARRLVTALKYNDRLETATMMAQLMVRASADCIDNSDVVMPVPLHWRRLISRRFNQSAELSRAISKQTGLPHLATVLKRSRATKQQVGLKASERALNVTGAFTVPEHLRHEIAGRRVLLVDDVFTTGATVTAAARALKRFGADEVNIAVFARVLDEF